MSLHRPAVWTLHTRVLILILWRCRAMSGGCTNGLLQDNVLYTEDNGEDVTCGQMVPYLQTMSVDVTEWTDLLCGRRTTVF